VLTLPGVFALAVAEPALAKKHHHGKKHKKHKKHKAHKPTNPTLFCGSTDTPSGAQIDEYKATKTTCAVAKTVAQSAPADRTVLSYTAVGFSCQGQTTTISNLPGAVWSCTQGSATVAFNETIPAQ